MFQSGPDQVEYNRVGPTRGHKISFFGFGPGRGKILQGITGLGYQKPCRTLDHIAVLRVPDEMDMSHIIRPQFCFLSSSLIYCTYRNGEFTGRWWSCSFVYIILICTHLTSFYNNFTHKYFMNYSRCIMMSTLNHPVVVNNDVGINLLILYLKITSKSCLK